MPSRAPRLLAVAVGAALALTVLAGCGGDDDAATTTAPSTTTTTAPATTTTAPPVTYVVQAGDSLSAIAERLGTTVAEIVAANGLTNPDQIAEGQVLVIPPSTTTTAPPAPTAPAASAPAPPTTAAP